MRLLTRVTKTADRILPKLLRALTAILQWRVRKNLRRIDRLQQANIELDRTTNELLDTLRRLEPETLTITHRQLPVDWMQQG